MDKIKYSYNGPVLDYNDRELGIYKEETHAESLSKAISNIRWKLAKRLSKKIVYIYNDLVQEVPEEEKTERKTYSDSIVEFDPDYNFEENDMDEKLSFEQAFKMLEMTYERKTLKKDLLYSNVEEFLNKQEVVTWLTKVNREKMLQAFNDAGYIDGADQIRIPRGTQFTYVTSKEFNNKVYDVYHIKGNRYCLVAICTDDMVELFGTDI